MNDLIAARSQMALSLGFHIIFSCIGMVMPFFMATAHYKYLRTGEVRYRNVAKAWSKGVAIFFATGAVSGTALSFELGLLWPGFMKYAGPIIGMPFSLEGTAFFIEAIALGFFLYGWKRLNAWFHWFTGIVVGLTGILSGVLVVSANSWMNSPAGFTYHNGVFGEIDPLAAMFNPGWFSQALHMAIAAFAATGFAVAGIHALMLLKNKNTDFHLTAFRISIVFAIVAALIQPFSGDISAKFVAKNQPAKLAAMEAHFKTESNASLIIGGIPDEKKEEVNYALKVPGMLSLMVYGNTKGTVTGLDKIAPENKPPVPVVHYAFQIMVGLWLFVLATPAGFIAIEAGWTVTEVGRQPWIIQGIMRTKDAVTPMPGINYSFYLFSFIYFSLIVAVVFLLMRHIRMVPYLYDQSN